MKQTYCWFIFRLFSVWLFVRSRVDSELPVLSFVCSQRGDGKYLSQSTWRVRDSRQLLSWNVSGLKAWLLTCWVGLVDSVLIVMVCPFYGTCKLAAGADDMEVTLLCAFMGGRSCPGS